MKRITIFSATPMEVAETKQQWINTPQTDFVACGVGILPATYAITKHLLSHQPDVVIMAGIAGAYDENITIGDVVAVEKEFLGNGGVWENGQWKDVQDLGFRNGNTMPFTENALQNPFLEKLNYIDLQTVSSNTVEEITTDPKQIQLYKDKYQAQIESMEGAPFHYCCLEQNIPFIQIRSISNYVGERDKSKWNFKDSIAHLNQALEQLLENIVNEN